mmetsp:Transcript_35106/g.105890  ORF Transcript_35106/g.105890 Transcript_35106/m.105890 type:complete len:265 (+) Transcript_35106:217-1011(+)
MAAVSRLKEGQAHGTKGVDAAAAAAAAQPVGRECGSVEDGGEATADSVVLWPVAHIQQLHDWDCGLVCARMAAEYTRSAAVSEAEVTAAARISGLDGTSSLWTIDICYVLKQLGVQHSFCTTCTGASEDHATEGFYAKTFVADSVRVNQLFHDADAHGVRVEKRLVSMDELVVHVRGGGLAIVLIDGSKMKDVSWYQAMFSTEDTGYYGHFLVLCGVSATGDVVYFADPASDDPVSTCSTTRFDAARAAYGTDNDVILIAPLAG